MTTASDIVFRNDTLVRMLIECDVVGNVVSARACSRACALTHVYTYAAWSAREQGACLCADCVGADVRPPASLSKRDCDSDQAWLWMLADY